ncbi:ABC transporter substrate-binding protein [Streptomyces sp. WMMC500]|uniref:ABC transporter substrate-binding protein n=1 Tax=Streptomyces sp. WMMC500 TaxID=3015154 RepID=UPI00248C4366|nr:ABC transporter substrate-binding protein [Streptomyces sp. WMMC500]WBB57662.1 ABC transporter substrate-binding protein [Streptomyces sp. WMMC500]
MKKQLWPCAIVLATALSLGACTGGGTAQQGAAADMLTVSAPNSAPTFTNNFNPFTGTAPGLNVMYEPLVATNRAKGGEVVPWLAEKWSWSDGGRTATFRLRPGVTFSDGSPLTAKDVHFSLDLLLKNPKVGGASYEKVEVVGDDSVAVTWQDPAYQQLPDLEIVRIVRAGLWSGRDPLTHVDKKPVGTGPFALETFSPQAVTMASRAGYWGGKMAMPHLKYTAATSANIQTQLQSNTVDFCTCDVDAKSYLKADPENHHFIMAWDGAVVSLQLNNARAPFSDVAVRRAFAQAVDTAQIAELSSSKLPIQQPQASPTGLSSKVYEDWIDPAYAKPRAHDPAAAEATLADAGYSVQDGSLVKDGKKIPVEYVVPSDTPFLKTIAQLVVEQIRESLGIEVKLVSGPGANTGPTIAKGDFDLAANWMSSGSGIYAALRQFDGTKAEPLGTEAINNPVRFRNDDFDRLLAKMAGTADEAELKKLGAQAQDVFVDQVPTVPLFVSGAAGVANSARWTGWPEAENPDYLANTGSGTEFITTLKHLKPAEG